LPGGRAESPSLIQSAGTCMFWLNALCGRCSVGGGKMTWGDYQSILETLEMLSDDKAVEQLRRSIKEVKEDKTIPWEKAKARLDV
jgi:hypothetical protein